MSHLSQDSSSEIILAIESYITGFVSAIKSGERSCLRYLQLNRMLNVGP